MEDYTNDYERYLAEGEDHATYSSWVGSWMSYLGLAPQDLGYEDQPPSELYAALDSDLDTYLEEHPDEGPITWDDYQELPGVEL